jgi:transglycosylase-like protein with SLT domain
VSPEDATRYATTLQAEAQQNNFDPLTGVAIIHHESRFHPRAVSPDLEDYGLAQVRVRFVGACKKDKDPLRRPSAACKAVKESLLDPDENIRLMSQMISFHRKICRKKAGSADLHRWLASYQGRNSVKDNRWCTPGEGTWSVIAYKDRLQREVTKRKKELEAPPARERVPQAEQPTRVADSREDPAPPPEAVPASGRRGG